VAGKPSSKKEGRCNFCGESNDLELHHVVPRRYGGNDSNANTVLLCADCHRKIERLYDASFYDQIGARADMTPNMMMDHIRELEGLLSNAISSVRTLQEIYNRHLKNLEKMEQLTEHDKQKRTELEIRMDTLRILTELEGHGIDVNFPTWDDYTEMERYREVIKTQFES